MMTTAPDYADAQLIIFDWDGTLFDSTGVIGHCLQQSCMALNLKVPNLREAQQVIGLGFDEAIVRLVGVLSAAQKQEFMAAYHRNYFAHENLVTLFDGMAQLLDELGQQGRLLTIATGKSRAGLNRVLNHNIAFKKKFVSSRTADETQSKPHPQMLLELLDELSVAPHQAVMVGDTTFDIDMANAAAVGSVAVTYGAHDERTLRAAQPAFVAHNVLELARIFGAQS